MCGIYFAFLSCCYCATPCSNVWWKDAERKFSSLFWPLPSKSALCRFYNMFWLVCFPEALICLMFCYNKVSFWDGHSKSYPINFFHCEFTCTLLMVLWVMVFHSIQLHVLFELDYCMSWSQTNGNYTIWYLRIQYDALNYATGHYDKIQQNTTQINRCTIWHNTVTIQML